MPKSNEQAERKLRIAAIADEYVRGILEAMGGTRQSGVDLQAARIARQAYIDGFMHCEAILPPSIPRKPT